MKRIAAISIMLVMSFLTAITFVSAHEGREVGPYEIEIGWRIEPAYVGLMNGTEVHIINTETEEGVEGLDETLQIEILFGPAARVLPLRPVLEEPGRYIADVIPTRPGDYTFRLFGTIGDVEVNETFSAADGQFSTVEPLSDLQFPDSEVTIIDLQAQIDELRMMIEELRGSGS